jgi:hypothetical protein
LILEIFGPKNAKTFGSQHSKAIEYNRLNHLLIIPVA